MLANTGVNAANFREQLSIADGAVMGTAFKYDGKFANQVDFERVRSLMDQIKQFRSEL
ncbi:putative sgc region protein SgcQ [compost metagenome]